MAFVYRCLAIKDVSKPFMSRCKEAPANNGILCKKHMGDVGKRPVHILMHKDVTQRFKIPFRNQVYVTIPVKNVNKPAALTPEQTAVRDAKVKVMKELETMSIDQLKGMHNGVHLHIWNEDILKNNPYAFRSMVCKAIVDKLLKYST